MKSIVAVHGIAVSYCLLVLTMLFNITEKDESMINSILNNPTVNIVQAKIVYGVVCFQFVAGALAAWKGNTFSVFKYVWGIWYQYKQEVRCIVMLAICIVTITLAPNKSIGKYAMMIHFVYIGTSVGSIAVYAIGLFAVDKGVITNSNRLPQVMLGVTITLGILLPFMSMFPVFFVKDRQSFEALDYLIPLLTSSPNFQVVPLLAMRFPMNDLLLNAKEHQNQQADLKASERTNSKVFCEQVEPQQ